MKKKILAILIIGGVLAFLYATNPTETDFMNYLDKQVKILKDKDEDSLKKFLVDLDRDTQKLAVNQGVTRKDRYFFSVFEIEDKEGNQVHRVLGFAGKIFFPLSPGPKEETPNIY